MRFLNVVHVGLDQREEWNTFVSSEPSFALLQSWEWGEFKEKLGWKAFRIAVENEGRILAGAQMLLKPLPLGFASVAYIPRGPVGGWLDKEISDRLFSELHRVAMLNGAIFLKIEPPLLNNPEIDEILKNKGFKAGLYNNQPRATITLDLTQGLEEIMRQMRKKTRTYIKAAAENGITVRLGGKEDLPAFYHMMNLTAQREEFSPRAFDYYEKEWLTFSQDKKAVLLMAYYQERLLVVRMVCRFGKHAAAFHSGSSKEYSGLRPNHLLVWEAIKWAKAQGCDTYDFWGIPDYVGRIVSEGNPPPVLDRTDGLWGVYRFKSGFSKHIVYYVGAYDYIYRPTFYRFITNKYINSDMLERVSSWMDSLGSKSLSEAKDA